MMDDHAHTPLWPTRGGIALIGFGLVAAFYILREHYAHALGALPYLLLLACPLMHLFMHHGHGGHAGHRQPGEGTAPDSGRTSPSEVSSDARRPGLRALDAVRPELAGVHRLRVQLRQAADPAGLAVLRGAERLHRRAVRQDVRLPLTTYLLSGWLQARHPGLDVMSHDAGHLWSTIFGLKGDPHSSLLHILSYLFVGGGFLLLSSAWNVLYQAQWKHRLAATGVYAHVRHPQYVAFIAIMFGFLLQWPTLLTLLMFPVLVGMYVRLAAARSGRHAGSSGPSTSATPRGCRHGSHG